MAIMQRGWQMGCPRDDTRLLAGKSSSCSETPVKALLLLAGRQLCRLAADPREKITLSSFLALFARFPSDYQAGNAWER